MRGTGSSRLFIWVIAVLTAGLLTTTLFAMNRSLQNAISPLFEAGRVQQTANPGTPSPATQPTPIVLATPTTVPAADPLVGVAFAAPLDGSNATPAPAKSPAPKAPAHTTAPKVLAAARPVTKAVAAVVPTVAAVLLPPARPVKATAELAAALHSPNETQSVDMAAIEPLRSPALAAIVLPIPRMPSVTVTPAPAPPAARHHHSGSRDSAENANGQSSRRG